MIIAKESENRYAAKPILAEMPLTVEHYLQTAAAELQGWLETNRCEHYRLSDIGDVLRDWLEEQIESLAQESLYHCVSGSSPYAVGRRTFEKLLEKKPYGASPEDIDKLYEADHATDVALQPEQEAA